MGEPRCGRTIKMVILDTFGCGHQWQTCSTWTYRDGSAMGGRILLAPPVGT